MRRTFTIEWPDDSGPLWMNRDNLLLCLTSYCPYTRFTVQDVTGDGVADPSPNSSLASEMWRERSEVYDAIDGERTYQDERWPSSREQSVGDEILLAEHYLELARHQWAAEAPPEARTMHFVRKVAGILVRAMERHGAPRREE